MKMFEDCIQLIQQNPHNDAARFQSILFDLAETLYNHKQEISAIFFLKTIIGQQKKDPLLLRRVYDLFARSEYKCSQVSQSPEYLELWLVQNMENFQGMKMKYFKNLVLLTFLVWKNLTKKMQIFPTLQKLAQNQQDYELLHYNFILSKMLEYMKKKNLKLNQEVAEQLRTQLSRFEFSKFTQILNKFYSEQILGQKWQ